jgi:hypothetical protein
LGPNQAQKLLSLESIVKDYISHPTGPPFDYEFKPETIYQILDSAGPWETGDDVALFLQANFYEPAQKNDLVRGKTFLIRILIPYYFPDKGDFQIKISIQSHLELKPTKWMKISASDSDDKTQTVISKTCQGRERIFLTAPGMSPVHNPEVRNFLLRYCEFNQFDYKEQKDAYNTLEVYNFYEICSTEPNGHDCSVKLSKIFTDKLEIKTGISDETDKLDSIPKKLQ